MEMNVALWMICPSEKDIQSKTNGHLMLTTNSLYYVASPQNQGKYKKYQNIYFRNKNINALTIHKKIEVRL